jgi:hypothetical protein
MKSKPITVKDQENKASPEAKIQRQKQQTGIYMNCTKTAICSMA